MLYGGSCCFGKVIMKPESLITTFGFLYIAIKTVVLTIHGLSYP